MGIEDIWILDKKFYQAAVEATSVLLKQTVSSKEPDELIAVSQLIYRFNACLYTALYMPGEDGKQIDFFTAAARAVTTYVDSLREVYKMPDEHQSAAAVALCYYCELLKRNLDDDTPKGA